MNFIFLLGDAGRADLGMDKRLIPNTYRFFEKYGGVKFLNAYSTSTWTLAVLVSMLTGMLPSQNGLNDITYANRRKLMEIDDQYYRADRCSDEDFLMTKLKRKGYTTKIFLTKLVHKFATKTLYNLFDKRIFWDFFFFQMDRIENEPLEQPFFWIIYSDDMGHSPYGRMKREKFKDYLAHEDKILDTTARIFPEKYTHDVLMELVSEQVRQYDEKLKAFWKWFMKSGLDKNTAVFFLSDHGEALQEHDWVGHVMTCYEEIVRIPLMVYVPGMFSRLREEKSLVSILDIMATVLGVGKYKESVNLFKPEKNRAVFFEFSREENPTKEHEFDSLPSPWIFIRGVRHENWKYLYKRHLLGNVKTELYNFSEKHEESRDTMVKDERTERFYFEMLRSKFNGIN